MRELAEFRTHSPYVSLIKSISIAHLFHLTAHLIQINIDQAAEVVAMVKVVLGPPSAPFTCAHHKQA